MGHRRSRSPFQGKAVGIITTTTTNATTGLASVCGTCFDRMKLSFSLAAKAKPSVGEAPSLQKPAAFGSFDDDEAAPTASSSKKGAAPVATSSWRPARRKEPKIDASVMQYDEVYDDMKDAEIRAKEASHGQSKDKKVGLTSEAFDIPIKGILL